jgi:hypothetical protein
MKTKPTSPSFIFAVSASCAVLIGFGALMLGDGLQGTLLAVRGFQEGFATTTIGFVMALFYAGFLFGSLITLKTVARVGHIRVFAALAAVASAAISIHTVFVTPVVWAILGLINACIFFLTINLKMVGITITRVIYQKKSQLSQKYNYIFAVNLIWKSTRSVIQEQKATMPSAV